jgi:hypothetical protein
MAKRRWGVGSGLALVALALIGGPALVGWSWFGSSTSDQAPRRGTLITEPRFGNAGAPSRQLGEDCSANAGSDCLGGGICLHYGPRPGVDYACSTRCGADVDCPLDWTCTSIYPAPDSSYCIPPPTWTPAVTTVRSQQPTP